MKKAIAWVIEHGKQPERLPQSALELEKHLEDWVEADIDIVADDVLLIGRQIPTSHGTIVDLLGIDADGNLVVIELKRDQTLRETVAQGIEYAAWASKCLYEEVLAIGEKKFGSQEKFAEAFASKFGDDLPESLNASQRVLLVAPEITDATAAVIEYLSETYRVPINGVSFDLLKLDDRQMLVRHVVREEGAAEPPPSKKRPRRTLEEIMDAARENGVDDLVKPLLELQKELLHAEPAVHAITLQATPPSGKGKRVAFTVYPTAATKRNRIQFWIYPKNMAALYDVPVETCEEFAKGVQGLGTNPGQWVRDPQHRDLSVEFSDLDQVTQFVSRFRQFVGAASRNNPPADTGAPATTANGQQLSEASVALGESP